MNPSSSSSSSSQNEVNEPPVPPHVYAQFNRLSIMFNKAFSLIRTTPPANACNPVSSDLFRIPNLTPYDRFYYRNLFLKTLRLFHSLLRCFLCNPNEAANLMRDVGLWLNRDQKVVGDLPGLFIGDVFMSELELCVVGLREHGMVVAGESSNGEPVAISVIVSDDDDDDGEVIVYTGKKCKHQKLEFENLALERSLHYGIEVRVIRCLKWVGGRKVYVYDGLYRVVGCWWSDVGVVKFRFVRLENQAEMGSVAMKLALRSGIRPMEVEVKGYVTLDLWDRKDIFPIYLYNDIDGDQDPLKYTYTEATIFRKHVYGYSNGAGCECVGGCVADCVCTKRNMDEFPYDCNGILVRGKPLVFECGPQCKCPSTCRNRVAQRGIKYRFEVFRSKGAVWKVRSLDLIQAGSFICEYAGVALTRDQAHAFTFNGDNLVYSCRFAERWKDWGDLSQMFSNYVCPAIPSIPPLDFAMDVSIRRNVASYISHSLTPNVFMQPVLHDHNNVFFPHLMLFALENIPPMRELTIEYGVADEDKKLVIRN